MSLLYRSDNAAYDFFKENLNFLPTRGLEPLSLYRRMCLKHMRLPFRHVGIELFLKRKFKLVCFIRESNPRHYLGRVVLYHLTNKAGTPSKNRTCPLRLEVTRAIRYTIGAKSSTYIKRKLTTFLNLLIFFFCCMLSFIVPTQYRSVVYRLTAGCSTIELWGHMQINN